MNIRSILGLAILTVFFIAPSGCKDRHNPLDMLFAKTQAPCVRKHVASEVVEIGAYG
jgi:hypothetical protein